MDQRDPHTEMLRETRYDELSLIPRPSRPVFVIHGSNKTNSGFIPCVSTASGKCWGKNGQGKSLGDTLPKNTVHSTVSQAHLACIKQLQIICLFSK